MSDRIDPGHGLRWLALLSFGPSRNGHFWSSATGPDLAEDLWGLPVHWYDPAGRLGHLPETAPEADGRACEVGLIESAWLAMEGHGVHCVIHFPTPLSPRAVRARQTLLDFEARATLAAAELSLVARGVRYREHGRQRVVTRWQSIDALDFVYRAATESHIVRRLLWTEDVCPVDSPGRDLITIIPEQEGSIHVAD
jgi:hypothetical protein